MATIAAAAPSTNDRLGFTFILAAALNALVIFGISNHLRLNQTLSPTLNITLATHKSDIEPERADFLAQHNQEASGAADEVQELTTDQRADFADTEIHEIIPLPQEKTTVKNDQQQELITTTSNADAKVSFQDSTDEAEKDKQAQDEDIALQSQEKAALQAKLARIRQTEAKRPKIRYMNSVRAKASKDAEYLNNWNERVERVALENFPERALRERKFGSLRIAVALNPDGSINNVEIISPSEHSLLNQSAIQIAMLASPFEPIPSEVLEDYDQLEIIRTWTFKPEGLKSEGIKRTKIIE